MVTRLAPDSRTLVAAAEDEARAARSPLVEAEHLLLAMTGQPGTDAADVLASAGLTHEAVQAALDREFGESLAVAGVSVDVGALPRPSPEPPRHLRLGASFKSAMVRSLAEAAGSRRIRPGHLLLGVLGSDVGTVPRALRLAGIDQDELASLVRHSLSD